MTERVLGIDFGLRHMGIAVGQLVTRQATPLTEIRANNGTPDWRAIKKLIEEWHPDRLIVGLPLNMDDTDNPITVAAREFAARLAKKTGLPTTLVDERLSTVEARERGGQHAVAAQVIVETWINEQP